MINNQFDKWARDSKILCPKCNNTLSKPSYDNGKCWNCNFDDVKNLFQNKFDEVNGAIINENYKEHKINNSKLENNSKSKLKSDAKAKLKEAKENLDLELITQAEYDKLKEELKPIIMSVSDDASDTQETEQINTQKSKQEVSSPTSKWVWIGGVLFILWLIGTLMPPTNTSSSSNTSSGYTRTHSCEWCGKSYKGKGFTTLMGVINRVDKESSPINSYCSRKCAREFLRNN